MKHLIKKEILNTLPGKRSGVDRGELGQDADGF